MKNYLVSIIAPATAGISITAETEDEAIRMAKAKMEAGNLSAVLDPEDANYADFLAVETVDNKRKKNPLPRLYTVELKAESVKEFPVLAFSEEEAENKVLNRYCESSALDFTENDVVSVDVSAYISAETIEATSKELLTQLVQIVRNTDASDEEMGQLLYTTLLKVKRKRAAAEN